MSHTVGGELWLDCLGPEGSRLKHGPNFNKVINTGDSAPRQLPPPPLLALLLTRTPALSCSLSALLPRLPSTLTLVGPPLLPTISRAPPSGPPEILAFPCSLGRWKVKNGKLAIATSLDPQLRGI